MIENYKDLLALTMKKGGEGRGQSYEIFLVFK
jgi:hypothetical protein